MYPYIKHTLLLKLNISCSKCNHFYVNPTSTCSMRTPIRARYKGICSIYHAHLICPVCGTSSNLMMDESGNDNVDHSLQGERPKNKPRCVLSNMNTYAFLSHSTHSHTLSLFFPPFPFPHPLSVCLTPPIFTSAQCKESISVVEKYSTDLMQLNIH